MPTKSGSPSPSSLSGSISHLPPLQTTSGLKGRAISTRLRRELRLIEVWLLFRLPCGADHSAYFGLANFIMAVRRLVVRLRGAAVAAGASPVRPDGPLLPDPSPLDPVSCSSLSSIRAISRQAPGRGRPQWAVRSARELVARDIPAGTCRFGGAPGARYLQLWSSRRAPHPRLRCRIRLPQLRGQGEPASRGSGADTVRTERALHQPGHLRW